LPGGLLFLFVHFPFYQIKRSLFENIAGGSCHSCFLKKAGVLSLWGIENIIRFSRL